MRTLCVLAAACLIAASAASLPAAANASPASVCDPGDTTGPELIRSSAVPTPTAVGVQDEKRMVYSVVLADASCTVGNVEAYGDHIGGYSSYGGLTFPLFFKEFDHDGNEVWSADVPVEPQRLLNAAQGRWKMWIGAKDKLNNYSSLVGAQVTLLRWSRITTNASPEPVSKGATITVAGKLSRASWDDLEYHGYANHPVDLQFRTPTGTYSTLETIDTSSTGTLKTTVKASADGCFRFVFRGSTTTAPVTGTGDCVDVR